MVMVRFLQKILNNVTTEKTLEDTILESTKQEVETQTTILEKKEGVYKELKETKSNYTGVPAPAYLQEDPWFGPVPEYTEKQRDYMEMEFEMKKQEVEQRKEETKEPEDIHEIMYQISQGNWNTVIESQGGSEHFHEGTGGWNSGNGFGQYR